MNNVASPPDAYTLVEEYDVLGRPPGRTEAAQIVTFFDGLVDGRPCRK